MFQKAHLIFLLSFIKELIFSALLKQNIWLPLQKALIPIRHSCICLRIILISFEDFYTKSAVKLPQHSGIFMAPFPIIQRFYTDTFISTKYLFNCLYDIVLWKHPIYLRQIWFWKVAIKYKAIVGTDATGSLEPAEI